MDQIRDVIGFIGSHFLTAAGEPLKGNPVAATIRGTCADIILRKAGRPDLLAKGAPGEGNWAEVPWIGLFDPEATTSATRGIYVVYLFSADLKVAYLSLAQGVTEIRKEFGAGRAREMQRRADLVRDRVPEYQNRFVTGPAELRGTTTLAQDYDAANIFFQRYNVSSLPPEPELLADLLNMVGLYELSIARGGVDSLETAGVLASGETGTIDETRRYVRHARIERSSKAAMVAKKVHGHQCQACGFDFETTYGERGHRFIEAHHLIPLSSLPEGEPVPMDPKEDFAVLCSNCHRMVHRRRPWLTLRELKNLLATGSATKSDRS